MKIKRLYLITEWSKDNFPEIWLGQLIKHYGVITKVTNTNILSGVTYQGNEPILISEKSVDDVTQFVEDMENITEEEMKCLEMNYPKLKLKL